MQKKIVLLLLFFLFCFVNTRSQQTVSWAFEFEGQSWFHGFRDLATNGVDKPVLNVFRMYGKWAAESSSKWKYSL